MSPCRASPYSARPPQQKRLSCDSASTPEPPRRGRHGECAPREQLAPWHLAQARQAALSTRIVRQDRDEPSVRREGAERRGDRQGAEVRACAGVEAQQADGPVRTTGEYVACDIGLLFVELCMRLLKPGGSPAIVLPDT